MRRMLRITGSLAIAAAGATSAVAQPADPFSMAMDFCANAIATGPLTAASDALQAAGWDIEYATNVGPSAQTLRAAQRRGPFGEAHFQAETAEVDGVFRLRCAIDIDRFSGAVDLEAAGQATGLDGTVMPLLGGGAAGSWMEELAEGVAVYTAVATQGYFGFVMTWAEWGGPGG